MKNPFRKKMSEQDLRFWCIQNCMRMGGFNLVRAKEMYYFLTATQEELKEIRM